MNKFLRLLRTRPFTKKGMVVYKPCMYYVHPSASVTIHKRLRFNEQWDDARILRNKMVGSLYVAEGGSLTVGSFVLRAGARLTVNKGAKLSLGSGSINEDCEIACFDSISIGNDVVISKRVVIRDSDNHRIIDGESSGPRTVSAPITICDRVWIGMNVTILKGVTIGEGAVIAAGSVVNKDIPARCLAAGVPAKVIKTDISWER